MLRYRFSTFFLMLLHYRFLLFLQSIFSFLSQTTVIKIDICLTRGKISQVRFTSSSTQHGIYLTSASRLTFARYSDKIVLNLYSDKIVLNYRKQTELKFSLINEYRSTICLRKRQIFNDFFSAWKLKRTSLTK